MKKEIFIDVNEDEVRGALVEDGNLAELFIERNNDQNIAGNVYLAKVVNVVEGIQAAFLSIGNKEVFLPLEEERIRKGDKVLIQITKEAIGNKSAKATTKISLPGRYLVYTPTSNKHGISKNIVDVKERFRLKEIVSSIRKVEGSFIVRTEAEGHKDHDLIRDAKYLMRLWKITERNRNAEPPKLLHRAFGIVFYIVRELFTDDFDMLVINSKKEFRDVFAYVRMVAPQLRRKIRFHKKETPLFNTYNLEQQISRIKDQKVPLQCGGSIVIQQTEALTSIDVNTGKYVSGRDREESAFIANCQAAREIPRQLMLRNIGGIIIVDFIDMESRKHNHKIHEILQEEIKHDKAKIDILPITRMGLLEMTRERKRDNVVNVMCQPCPYCKGSGLVFDEITMYIKIKKEILRMAPETKNRQLDIFMHPKVAALFDDKKVNELSRAAGKQLKIRPDYKLHQEEFEIK